MSDKNSLWDSAAKAGLVLGGISVAYLALTALTGMLGGSSKLMAVLMYLANLLLWCIKFGACLYMMRFFMLKFYLDNPESDNQRVFRFGEAVALLSAVIYSVFYLAYMKFIAPDAVNAVLDSMKESPMMTSEMADQMDQMASRMPLYTFFGNLIYCTLFGIVLAAIYSRNIPPQNPFTDIDNHTDEQ